MSVTCISNTIENALSRSLPMKTELVGVVTVASAADADAATAAAGEGYVPPRGVLTMHSPALVCMITVLSSDSAQTALELEAMLAP